MSRLLLIASWSLVRVIVWPARAGGEDDRVAAAGGLDRVPQGARPAVEVVGHRQGAEDGPALEALEPRAEHRACGGSGCGGLSGGRIQLA